KSPPRAADLLINGVKGRTPTIHFTHLATFLTQTADHPIPIAYSFKMLLSRQPSLVTRTGWITTNNDRFNLK
ncbi:hypothetical protein, partial [Pseudomonas syringae group genomosp. 3]|uniref:hypothetical protein n=1 Tax=Pseudomonas syringae group genomosp. 3 TaxID=251701 RepID=UPI001C80F7E1